VSIEVNGFALQGLDRAQQKLERAARRIAQSGAEATTPPEGDAADLSTSMVEVIEAVNLYKANANMVKAEDEMTKRVLNILA
jgi:flagellar hook protein FlgE